MSSRAYLSIGDVLTLLREEFPDVTISKIRFLESQGLVNPERSPSGYRKFFEHDVERLRWVLRQQREHFLPLKVIRDRLASGDLGDDLPAGPAASVGVAATRASGVVERNGQVHEPAAAVATPVANGSLPGRHAGSSGLRSVASVGAGADDEADDEPLTKADSDAMARILADASRRSARLPEAGRPALRAVRDNAGPGEATPSQSVITRGAAEPAVSEVRAVDAAPVEPAAKAPDKGIAAGRGGRAAAEVAAKSKAAAGAVASTPPVPSKTTTPTTTAPGRSAEGAKPAGRAPAHSAPPAREASAMSGMVTGASLTAEELCGASGLSEIELASLEGFGLIAATLIAGLATYDEDALTVANLAAELRVFGIEPRHLRLYKNAVDREVGLIEQVIIPLLRQRNPESRQRALDSADQLAALGQTMRATLLRSALRRHVGG